MSAYELLLFLHLIGAFALIGSVVVYTALFAGGERVAGPPLTALARRLWDVGGGLTLLFGVWLAFKEYSIVDGWILGALVLWVVAAAVGGRAQGEPTRGMYGVMAVVTLAILVLMIWKPGA